MFELQKNSLENCLTLEKTKKSSYRAYLYGFQGQEKDDEIKGEGNSIEYKYRVHDPRLGRFLSVDPLAPVYPWYSPYQFSGNRTIDMIELEGLEPADAPSKENEIKAAPYTGDGENNGKEYLWAAIENEWKVVANFEAIASEQSKPPLFFWEPPSLPKYDFSPALPAAQLTAGGIELFLKNVETRAYINSPLELKEMMQKGRLPNDVSIVDGKRTSNTISKVRKGAGQTGLILGGLSSVVKLVNGDIEGAFFDGGITGISYYYPAVGFTILTFDVLDYMAENNPNCPRCSIEHLQKKLKNSNDWEERRNYYKKLEKLYPPAVKEFNNPLYIYSPTYTIGPANSR